MGFISTFQRSRRLQVVSFLFFVVTVYYFFISGSGSGNSYTPEDINSMLQDKHESVHIHKKEIQSCGLRTPYLDASSKFRDWQIKGHAMVRNNEFIRLTQDKPSQVGSIFARNPLQAESFEMELTFSITGSSSIDLHGDGMAIWLIDRRSEIGDVFGGQNYFNGLGIFIDTYKNGKRGSFPYVNIMQGNGEIYYNKHNDGYDTRLAGCHLPVINTSGRSKARLVYIRDGYFSLDFDVNGKGKWKNCVTLSNVKLPGRKFLGFSAETGALSENVDIYENKIFALYKPNGQYVSSIEDLETIMEEQNEEPRQKISNNGPQSKKSISDKARKSITRLRKAEKRIKQRERELRKEKYGDPDISWLRRMLHRIWKVLIWFIYFIIILFACWIAFTIYRVQKQRNRPRTTGILD